MKTKTCIPILIVDDKPANLLALEAVLTSPDYLLIRATSGQETLDLLKEHDYALILLDVQMPGMDGFETATFIRQRPKSRNIPIIFITASIEDSSRIYKGYEAGAVDYIFKPFEPEILQSKVAVFAELYQSKQEILRQAELLRLRDEQERDSFLENALDAVVGMNEEGNIIYWNHQAEIIFGWTKTEATGLRMSEVIIPHQYRQLHEDGLQRFLSTEVGPILRKRIEITALRKNGNEFPVELTVTPIKTNGVYKFSAFVRDISERKQFEAERRIEQERLRESEAQFRTLADSIPQLAWMADSKGWIYWYNQQWYDYTGTTLEEMEGQGWKKIHHPDHVERVVAKISRFWETGDRWEDTFPLRSKDGEWRWFLSRATAVRDGKGNIVKFFGTNTDITEQLKAQEELQKIDEALRSAIKARDEFVSIASHELKTPLTTMKLHTQMTKRNMSLQSEEVALSPEKVKKFIDQTDKSVERLSHTVDDMLDFSRISTGKLTLSLTTFNLSEVVKDSLERLSPLLIQAHCSLKLNASREIVGTWDRFRIEQVLSNLVTNAAKYGAGRLIEVTTQKQAERAIIIVKDHGPGIAEEDQVRIFKRFERAVPASEISGLGLGLYIASEIIERHKGSIKVESTIGQGASFIVTLPMNAIKEEVLRSS